MSDFYEKEVFVFGSNEAGIHGAGSARAAYEEHGAVLGIGVGLSNKSYAIPTKDKQLKVLSLIAIESHVANFINFAGHRPKIKFNIVDIGCGLAGFSVEQIAPMFKNSPENCFFLGKFKDFLGK